MRTIFLKRAMPLLMALCMVLSAGSIASATDETVTEPKVNLNLHVIRVENTITAEIAITENTANFKDLQVKIDFDPAQFEYQNSTAGDADLNLLFNKDPNKMGSLNVIASHDQGFNGTGVVYTATFAIKPGASQTTSVAFDPDWLAVDTNAKVTYSVTQGVAVSGQIASANPNAPCTVTLKQGDTVKHTLTVPSAEGQDTQSFTFPQVTAGTYDLVVSKEGSLTSTVTGVIVKGEDLDLSSTVIKLIPGDLDGNGYVDTTDLGVLISSENYDLPTTEAAVKIADLDGNGYVDTTDLGILISSENYDQAAPTIQYTPAGTK